MKKISEKEKKRQAGYAAQRVKDLCEDLSCQKCGATGNLANLQRHHPDSRKDIFNYIYLCMNCHSWVHHFPAEARREGWLK